MANRLLFSIVYVVFLASRTWSAEGDPLSAIEWLSDSVALPEEAQQSEDNTLGSTLPTEITVVPLDQALADDAGLFEASELGLNSKIWGRSAAAELAREITRLPDGNAGPPVLRRFLAELLAAKFDPPIDAAIDGSLLLARVDRLLAMGHLETAERLLSEADLADPDRFRRYFDIALLRRTETEACKSTLETPEISPTYPARIYCLARLGEWDVAALTLGNAEALNILTPEEDALLLHFLDPELFEGEPIPRAPRQPSPLTFRLYEAIGERIQTDGLPLAFAHADLSDTLGWKTRLRAAERLVTGGAIPFETYLTYVGEQKPAASGGIWDRATAFQGLAGAVWRGDRNGIAEYLPDAWQAAKREGYGAPFAIWAADWLRAEAEIAQLGHLGFEIALLAERPDLAQSFARDVGEDKFLLSLTGITASHPPGRDALSRAVLRGLTSATPGSAYEALIADDRAGEALLRALSQLMSGAAGNPEATKRSLALLRELGLGDLARQVAVELVLIEGRA